MNKEPLFTYKAKGGGGTGKKTFYTDNSEEERQ